MTRTQLFNISMTADVPGISESDQRDKTGEWRKLAKRITTFSFL